MEYIMEVEFLELGRAPAQTATGALADDYLHGMEELGVVEDVPGPWPPQCQAGQAFELLGDEA